MHSDNAYIWFTMQAMIQLENVVKNYFFGEAGNTCFERYFAEHIQE